MSWEAFNAIATAVTAAIILISVIPLLIQLLLLRRATIAQVYETVLNRVQREEIRKARARLFRLNGVDLAYWFESDKEAAEMVCHNYDSVATMVRTKLFPMNIVSNWRISMIKSFIAARLFIDYRRCRHRDPELWKDFQWLVEKFMKSDGKWRNYFMNDERYAPDRDVLLVEYQAAQASAEHHDNLVWTWTSIIWGATLVALGFIVDNLADVKLRWVLTVISGLGIVLVVVAWVVMQQFNSLKNQKYARCKEIENICGMTQHTSLKYSGGSQRIIYSAITLIYIVIWFMVLRLIW